MHIGNVRFLCGLLFSVSLVACGGRNGAAPVITGLGVPAPQGSSSPVPGSSSAPSSTCTVQLYQSGSGTYNGLGTCGIGVAPVGASPCEIQVAGGSVESGWCLPAPSASPGAVQSATPQPAAYLALGDSLTVGYGSSACPTILSCLGTTSPTQAGTSNPSPTTPGNNGYAQTFAVQLARGRAPVSFTFDALGVAGALTGDAPLTGSEGSVLTNPAQIPAVPSIVATERAAGGKVLITLWAGSNDVFDATSSGQCSAGGGRLIGWVGGPVTSLNPCASSGTTLEVNGDVRQGSFYAGYLAVLKKIAATSPDGFIALGIIDISRVPGYASAGAAQQTALAQACVAANAAIQAALTDAQLPHAVFLDLYSFLAKNPQYYGSAYFSSDGVDPNDQGYAVIEQQLSALYASSFPGF